MRVFGLFVYVGPSRRKRRGLPAWAMLYGQSKYDDCRPMPGYEDVGPPRGGTGVIRSSLQTQVNETARAFGQVAANISSAFAIPAAQAATALIALCPPCTGTGRINAALPQDRKCGACDEQYDHLNIDDDIQVG